MSIVLTDEQQQVIDSFKEFLNSEEPFFLLSAPAGTGKTFLTKYLYNEVYTKDPNIFTKYTNFVFTATTHKAVNALETQLLSGDNPLSGVEVKTIHSLLGLDVKYDYDKGETLLKLKPNSQIIFYTIIVVDECSMIDSCLLKFIRTRLFKSKVIFIGDDKQLPPVKSGKTPPVFEIPNLEKHTLTKPIRNKNHDELKDLCAQLRKTVDTGVPTPIEPVGNIKYLNAEDFSKQIAKDFLEPNMMNKILAYTNKRVNFYNELVAKLRGKTQYYNEGDYYVLAEPTLAEGSKESVLLHTDTEIKIKSLSDLQRDDYYNIDYYTAVILVPYYNSRGEERKDSPQYLIKIPASFTDLKTTLGDLKTKAVKETNNIERKARWVDYFNCKETFSDLRYRDSSTVHKAQGTTFKNVYIDLSDLGTCTNPDTFNKLLYVAVSRARDYIYLTGSLPSKYGSVILRD